MLNTARMILIMSHSIIAATQQQLWNIICQTFFISSCRWEIKCFYMLHKFHNQLKLKWKQFLLHWFHGSFCGSCSSPVSYSQLRVSFPVVFAEGRSGHSQGGVHMSWTQQQARLAGGWMHMDTVLLHMHTQLLSTLVDITTTL